MICTNSHSIVHLSFSLVLSLLLFSYSVTSICPRQLITSRVRVNSPDLAPKTPQRQLIMAAEEPRQREDPAASGKNWKQQQVRRSAENLAPRFFALLFALLALYILFSPPSSSLSPPVDLSSTSTSYSVPTSQVIPDKNIAKMSSSEQT